MAADAEVRAGGWNAPSRRRVPRVPLQAPVDVTVARSGTPDTVPGRSLDVGERGVGAMIAGELVPGESVTVEVYLASGIEPLRFRAMVRYHDKLRCGLEFVGLSPEQRAAIRGLTRDPRTEVAPGMPKVVVVERTISEPSKTNGGKPGGLPRYTRVEFPWLSLLLTVIVLAAVGAFFWWHWNREWEKLESAVGVVAQRPAIPVGAEVMQKLLIHRVEPVYPAEARAAGVEGVIALIIVVGRDGSVVTMRPLNGPEILARAAMDSMRWWKFEPYRVNGEPTAVETTLAVEFKRK